jgi:2'-hydroxyisoflavone reductase
MRILIAGGTQFVGRHIAEAALARGHDVTLLHRGRTGAGLFPEARHVLADRNGDLAELRGGEWDATIDVSGYEPGQVERLADVLTTGRYVYISSVSAYDNPAPGYAEDAALRTDADSYGGLKAACERAAAARFPGRLLILRPTYVVGPYDHLVRFTWWAQRLARGGEVLAPGEPDAPIQVIDARDLAAWTVALTEAGTTGAFHTCGPASPISFRDLLQAMAGPDTRLTWVDPGFLLERGVGGEDLPLWPAGDEEAGLNRADPGAALAAGLTLRPLADTVRDTLATAEPQTEPPVGRLGAEREAELLREWHQR